MSKVNLQFLRFGLRPPPFIDLLLQAEIENSEAYPLWVVFPYYIEPSSQFGKFYASAVEIFELPGKGTLRIARFMGDGSFQTMCLFPGAHVRIHEFPITLVGEPPKSEITIPVILARRLHIGEQPAEKWFPVEMISSLEADVTEEPGAIVASQDTPRAEPILVTPSNVQRMNVNIALRKL
jgi:hypothetical protein